MTLLALESRVVELVHIHQAGNPQMPLGDCRNSFGVDVVCSRMSGAVIVGAGPLIGLSLAHRFAREGLPISVLARSQATIDSILSVLAPVGVSVTGIIADAGDERGLQAALDATVAEHGVPDVLVYNAGVIRADRPGELSATEILDTFAVNAIGAMTAGVHVGERMAARGRGTILITGGMPEPVAAYSSLSIGKAGVRAVTTLLASEYGSRGVHVATVTVVGAVVAGTGYDPDTIAESYWYLHQQPSGEWDQEFVFRA
jgi:short-subunit dehydrogenase